jgi:hypothetical protein
MSVSGPTTSTNSSSSSSVNTPSPTPTLSASSPSFADPTNCPSATCTRSGKKPSAPVKREGRALSATQDDTVGRAVFEFRETGRWLAVAANFHMQNDDEVEASLQALRYQRLAGYSRSDTELERALIARPRPVADAMRMIDEIAVWRPPGSQDLPRAALLAMLGRFDEAWPLAEARSSHLREVTGDTSRDAYAYLSFIATIEGDQERAVRYGAEEIELIAHIAIPAATAKARLARDLCYLARFDEAERLLEEARAVPPPGSGVRVMAAAAEALLLAHRGDLERLKVAVADDPRARQALESDGEPGDVLASLRSLEGDAGAAATAYLDLVGYRLINGFDISEPYALELPDATLAASGLDQPSVTVHTDRPIRVLARRP